MQRKLTKLICLLLISAFALVALVGCNTVENEETTAATTSPVTEEVTENVTTAEATEEAFKALSKA